MKTNNTRPNPGTWDKIAEDYSIEISKPEIELANEIRNILLSLNIKPGASILEMGCGSGHLSGLLARYGYDVTLLDFSEIALEKAKEFFKKNNLKARFIKYDFMNLNELKEEYDVIWNSGVMEHFNEKDLEKIFPQIREKVKKYFIFLVPNPESLPYLLFRYKLMIDEKWAYGHEYVRFDYNKFLTQSNFRIVEKRYLGSDFTNIIMSMAYPSNNITSYIKELIDNGLFPDSNKYLVTYVAESDNNTKNNVCNNTNKINDNRNISMSEYITEKFDLIAKINSMRLKLSEYENENLVLKTQNNNKDNEIIRIKDEYQATRNELNDLIHKYKVIQNDFNNLRADFEKNKIELGNLHDINKDYYNLINEHTRLQQKANDIKYELNKTKFDLDLIYKSDFWKVALKYYKIRDNIWPFNKIYEYLKNRRFKKKIEKSYITKNNDFVHDNIKTKIQGNMVFTEKHHDEIEVNNNLDLPNIYDKYDILFFSVIDWNFRYQRPQQIASYMAESGHRVFYVNANFKEDNTKISKINDKIFAVTLPDRLGSRIYDIDLNNDLEYYKNEIDKIIAKNFIKDCVIFIEYPTWEPLINNIKNKYNFKVIFDYLDDFAGFNTNNSLLINSFEKTMLCADLVISSSKYLYERAKDYNKNVQVVRNGTEYLHFNKALNKTNNKQRPIIGYYGAIAEWFDVNKIEYIANNRPDYDIFLIGDTTYSNIEEIRKFKNVKFLGEKKYTELPDYLKEFDVCIIPFRTDIDLIKATNPVKFYEYLSAGKKIVATEIPEIQEYKDRYVYLTNDDQLFLKYIDMCINDNDTLAPLEERLEFAKQQDWKQRCKTIQDVIKDVHKLVSIIMVTYNNLNYTKECLNSIFNKTAYPSYEIVIVDNNSCDNTQEYLKQIESNHKNVTIVLNKENYGFAKGNNIGYTYCKGEYIVLLNNDTVVTAGWLTNLIKHLEKNNNLAMVGPVTNSIGNEAQINTRYQNIKEMHIFAENYTSEHFNKEYKDIYVLAMFCVAMRKQLIERIGLLDENFGIGMFEDDDYSLRIRNEGYDIACAEDVFIHHYGSASFKKIGDKEYKKIFEANKKKFEDKWKRKWVPHKYREGVI